MTGGIAAYKACELVRLLVKAGHEVIPLVTPAAERFVRAETFHALARRSPNADPYPHLENADLLVVAPLTANTLAKLANGLADNLVTEAALAHEGPVLLAPAMNTRMWNHPATQTNVRVLRSRGVDFVGPVEGELGEGESGIGRMAEPRDIFRRSNELLRPDDELPLREKRVVVTAGGTREQIDAVRFMNVRTAEELEREVQALADADVLIMAAAVADYRPARARSDKRPKDREPWEITLEPTDDILAKLGTGRRNGQVLVGFAAETGEAGLARAREKRAAKNVDLIVYNDVGDPGIGFESLDNEVVLISEAGERHVERAPKSVIAGKILDEVERLLGEGNGGS